MFQNWETVSKTTITQYSKADLRLLVAVKIATASWYKVLVW